MMWPEVIMKDLKEISKKTKSKVENTGDKIVKEAKKRYMKHPPKSKDLPIK
ncbi:MAG: hypothetical protein FD133_1921 [Erysipelotrichaceae bacterium]|nr:MAG: hypothetical protein FD133_1921 [Erysipelotrichaceae bacterium]